MKSDFERFDMTAPPVRTKWYLRPITWLLSMPDMIKHKNILHREGTQGLKPPFLLLCNHNAFMDFKVATKAIFPKRANYVVAIDGFIGREKLLRDVGCICKRKFTSDTMLVKQLMRGCGYHIPGGEIFSVRDDCCSACVTREILQALKGAGRSPHMPRAPYQFAFLEPA